MIDASGVYDCDKAVHVLWDYLDERLPEEARERVVRHLEQCVECTGHFAFEQSFLNAVRTLRRDDAEFVSLRLRVLGALRSAQFREAD